MLKVYILDSVDCLNIAINVTGSNFGEFRQHDVHAHFMSLELLDLDFMLIEKVAQDAQMEVELDSCADSLKTMVLVLIEIED